ncbi:hypothetical protein D3C76_1567140 [compost metagenome]
MATCAAFWMKSGRPYTMHSDRFAKWSHSDGGATTQPIRQPDMAWDLDRLLMVAVRPAIPGRLAGLMCSPS